MHHASGNQSSSRSPCAASRLPTWCPIGASPPIASRLPCTPCRRLHGFKFRRCRRGPLRERRATVSGSASVGMASRQPGQFRPAAQRGGTTAGPGSGALNRGGPGPGCLGDVDGRRLFSLLGIGVAGLAVGITRSREDPRPQLGPNSLGDGAARVSRPGSARKVQESSPPFGGRSRGAGVGREGSRACQKYCVRIHKSADIFYNLSRLEYQDFSQKWL